MPLKRVEKERIEDGLLKLQSVANSLNQVDSTEIPHLEDVQEALRAQHNAIESVEQRLWDAVLSGASRAEVINIMNAAITFCSTQFAGEEAIMRNRNYEHLAAHIVAHKQLLTEIVGARRNAAGEGLSLAVLDVSAMLDAYHKHVDTFDLAFAYSLVSPLSLVDPLHSHGFLPKAGPSPADAISPVG
jgi:hemerythrin